MFTRSNRLIVAAGLVLAGTAPAVAADGNQQELVCSAYAKMGGAVADFILPMTFKQMLDMQHGRDTQLATRLTQKLLGSLTGAEIVAMGRLSNESRSSIMKSANDTTYNLLMSGKASDARQVVSALTQHCKTQIRVQ